MIGKVDDDTTADAIVERSPSAGWRETYRIMGVRP
jgi:hypothetical protein